MWDPLDRYMPSNPLLRGASAGLLWLLGMFGLFAIVADPIAALFLGPFVILAVVFSAQLARSAYRGESDQGGTTAEVDPSPDDATDEAFDVLRARYARGEIDHEEFERRVANILDAESEFDAVGDDRKQLAGVERE